MSDTCINVFQGILLLFQNVAQGILITTKSYLLRTAILSLFFFLVLPVGKLILLKLGLLGLFGLTPAGRAGHDGGGGLGASPDLQTEAGFLESYLFEIKAWIETFYDISEFDDYLYA